MDKLSPINIYDHGENVAAMKILQAINYGDPPVFWLLNSTWGMYKQITDMYCVWDAALVSSLAKCLFGSSIMFDRLKYTGYYAMRDTGFEGRCNEVELEILLRTLAKYSQSFTSGGFMFPHSHLVACLRHFISYLRERMGKSNVNSDEYRKSVTSKFLTESSEYWRSIYRMFSS